MLILSGMKDPKSIMMNMKLNMIQITILQSLVSGIQQLVESKPCKRRWTLPMVLKLALKTQAAKKKMIKKMVSKEKIQNSALKFKLTSSHQAEELNKSNSDLTLQTLKTTQLKN